MSGVIVLHAPSPGHFAGFDAALLLPRLPYAKRLELERRERQAREAALAGIALALDAACRLRGVPAPVSELRFPPGGKPTLDGGPFFSISHTDGCVACAASLDCDLGFDFEFVPVGADEAARARLRRWTATEAVLKAAGLGLREVAQVEVDRRLRFGTVGRLRYGLSAIDLGSAYAAHLAMRQPASDIRIESVLTGPDAPRP